jgi:high-affinity K+ transport system ATPase subunit B
MLFVSVKGKVNQLAKALGDEAPKRLKKEVASAVNAAAKRTQNLLAKEVSKELATSQKVIKEGISVTKKATQDSLNAEVTQKESQRLSLKRFSAQQTKTGVRYKVSKTQGRKFVKSAFKAMTLGEHIYKREGKTRLPIQKLHGASPWGVTVKNKLDEVVTNRDIKPELIKQLDRRIKAVNFKKSQG